MAVISSRQIPSSLAGLEQCRRDFGVAGRVSP
jgi:hypothetical protein